MSEMYELLEVKPRTYDEWKKHLEEKKKKYNHRTNSSKSKGQSEAKDCLYVISTVEKLMDIEQEKGRLTLGIQVICSMFDNGILSEKLPILINAFKKDAESIKMISESKINDKLKKQWDRKIGKGIVDDKYIYEKVGLISEVVCAIIPVLFLIELVISGYTRKLWETEGGVSPLAFFIPLGIFIVLKLISKWISKEFYVSNHLLGRRLGIIVGLACLVLAFVPPIGQGLKNLNSACRSFYVIYLYLATSIQVTNKFSGPVALFSDIRRMIEERNI